MPSQVSTDTFPWGKVLWGRDVSEEEQRSNYVLPGGINDKEKSISACTSSGQAGLSLARWEKPRSRWARMESAWERTTPRLAELCDHAG